MDLKRVKQFDAKYLWVDSRRPIGFQSSRWYLICVWVENIILSSVDRRIGSSIYPGGVHKDDCASQLKPCCVFSQSGSMTSTGDRFDGDVADFSRILALAVEWLQYSKGFGQQE